MYRKILLASSVAVVLFSGCSSKQYYEPEQTHNTSSSSMNDNIIHYSRDGATLASGAVLTNNQRVNLKLEKGFYFINSSKNAAITANAHGKVNIVNEQGTVATATFPKAVVSATLIGKYLVYVLQNNTFGVYNFETKALEYNGKAQKAFAIDTRIANPLKVDKLVIIPTLDGKLTILDLTTFKISKEMYVSTETSLNNIIFLERLNNTLIAATPNKVLSINNKGKKELNTAISEVIIQDKELFVFAKDGRILKLDESLTIHSEKKFKFAHFSLSTVYKDKVYALDKQGFLIVSNKSFSKHKVYDVSAVESYAFVSEGKLYYDRKIVELSTLNYE